MAETWYVLVVDDEPDIHEITKIALRHQKWRERGFKLAHAHSAEEARTLLNEHPPGYFDAALIDVVMEAEDAGLKLCEHIRQTQPPSLRIILRTGQPGSAPEELVLNQYDIDYYLAKTEASREKLLSVIRACLRSSQDISTLLAFGRQIQSFTRALQTVSSIDDLLVFMREGLGFLEAKHFAKTTFYYDVSSEDECKALQATGADSSANEAVYRAIRALHQRGASTDGVYMGSEVGLPTNSIVIPFRSSSSGSTGSAGPQSSDRQSSEAQLKGAGGMYAEVQENMFSDKSVSDLAADAKLFIENWKIAYTTLSLQEKLAHETLLREQMYNDRMASIARMVTGVAHEMNTPLGVANTACGMITRLMELLIPRDASADPEQQELIGDLDDSCHLLQKNLTRAQRLIGSFKQLSASQLSDHRSRTPLLEIIDDCVATMGPELQKKQIVAEVQEASTAEDFIWEGYSGHLSQVIVNFIQNTVRYAYKDGRPGKIQISVSEKADTFEVLYRDFGDGVDPEVAETLFEPFVTTGRRTGGTGLGLSIVQNIVTDLLSGSIACASEVGKGATFTVVLPKVVPVKEKST